MYKMLDRCDLVGAKVVTTQITLHLLQLVEYLSDVVRAQILLGIFWQYLQVQVIEHLLGLDFRLRALAWLAHLARSDHGTFQSVSPCSVVS